MLKVKKSVWKNVQDFCIRKVYLIQLSFSVVGTRFIGKQEHEKFYLHDQFLQTFGIMLALLCVAWYAGIQDLFYYTGK